MNNLLQEKLIIATTLDKQWSPSIYMQLDTAQNFVDFVPMLKPSNLDKSMFLSKGYPPGASLKKLFLILSAILIHSMLGPKI